MGITRIDRGRWYVGDRRHPVDAWITAGGDDVDQLARRYDDRPMECAGRLAVIDMHGAGSSPIGRPTAYRVACLAHLAHERVIGAAGPCAAVRDAESGSVCQYDSLRYREPCEQCGSQAPDHRCDEPAREGQEA